MLEQIKKYVTSLLPIFKKDRVKEDSRVLRGILDNFSIPAYKDAVAVFEKVKFKSKDVKEKEKDFDYIAKKTTNGNLLDKVLYGLEGMHRSLDELDKYIDKNMEDEIATAGSSAGSVTVIRALEVGSFVANYSLLLLNWIYWSETTEAGEDSKHGAPSSGELKYIETKYPDFCRAIALFIKNQDDWAKLISNIPEVVIGTDVADGALSSLNAGVLDPANLGIFEKIENPIYHVRLVVAEYQNKVYARNKELKTLLELRALRLQQQLENTPSPQVEKELEYTQSRIESLNAKIRDYDKKVG